MVGGGDELELCLGAFISVADAVSALTFSFGPGTDSEASMGLLVTDDATAVTGSSLILPVGFTLLLSDVLVIFSNAPPLSVLARISTSELADTPGVESIRLWLEPAALRTQSMPLMIAMGALGDVGEPALLTSLSSSTILGCSDNGIINCLRVVFLGRK